MSRKQLIILEGTMREGGIDVVDPASIVSEGNYKENMSFAEGLEYLRSYQFGMLGHPSMETLDFLFIRENGVPAFYDHRKDTVELVHDLGEFDESEWTAEWFYLPGFEFGATVEGVGLWDRIRVQAAINDEPASLGF